MVVSGRGFHFFFLGGRGRGEGVFTSVIMIVFSDVG